MRRRMLRLAALAAGLALTDDRPVLVRWVKPTSKGWPDCETRSLVPLVVI